MPTVHMIHGFVGAGKTTFSKKLEKEVNAVRFTPDEWICDLYGDTHGDDNLPEYQARVDKVIRKIAEGVLASERDVILDFGFWKKVERDDIRRWAGNLGTEVKLYKLTCPDEVMEARVLTRSEEMPDGVLFIDRNAIGVFRKMFEPVDPQVEGCIVISTG